MCVCGSSCLARRRCGLVVRVLALVRDTGIMCLPTAMPRSLTRRGRPLHTTMEMFGVRVVLCAPVVCCRLRLIHSAWPSRSLHARMQVLCRR